MKDLLRIRHFFSTGMIILFIGLFIIANYVSYKLFIRIDLTSSQIYSLSKASKNIITKLDDPINIRAYFSKNLPPPYNTNRKYIEDLLGEYVSYSRGKIKVHFIDADKDEETKKEALSFGIPALSFTQVAKGKYEVKEGYMGIIFMYAEKKEIIPFIKHTSGLEYDVTSIIRKLVFPEKKVIGFTQGHNEYDIEQTAQIYETLKDNYDIKKINLTAPDTTLDNIDSLIILGPKQEFSVQEKIAIDQYIMKGGPAAFFFDKFDISIPDFKIKNITTGLDDLFETYGVKIGKGIIGSTKNQVIAVAQKQGQFTMQTLINFPYFLVADDINTKSPVVKDVGSITFPFCSYFELIKPQQPEENIKADILIKTDENSWAKEDLRYLNPLERITKSKQDKKGPFIIAAALKGRFRSYSVNKATFTGLDQLIKESKQNRVLIVANSNFVQNTFAQYGQTSYMMFLNAIDWLVQDEALIGIRLKSIAYHPLKEVSHLMRIIIRYLNMLLMPVLLLVFGFFYWHRRKLNIKKMGLKIRGL